MKLIITGFSNSGKTTVKYWPSPNAFNDADLAKKSTNYKRFATSAFSSLYAYSKLMEKRLRRLSHQLLSAQEQERLHGRMAEVAYY